MAAIIPIASTSVSTGIPAFSAYSAIKANNLLYPEAAIGQDRRGHALRQDLGQPAQPESLEIIAPVPQLSSETVSQSGGVARPWRLTRFNASVL